MFIDTHMHINDKTGVNPDLYIKNAINNNVLYMISSFCDIDDYKESVNYINKYNNLFACIGFHPEYADFVKDSDYKKLEELVKNNEKIVAIGEIGLDYHYGKENRLKQIEVFEKQLSIAQKLNVPVVIHTRDSINETYEILKKYDVKGVIHCFSGSFEMAQKFIDLGFKLGIGGVVTFSNSKLYQVIEKLDLNNILLETDSPYLAPHPFRGTINESKNILIIAKKISEIKKIDIDYVEKITTNNAISLFDLNIKI